MQQKFLLMAATIIVAVAVAAGLKISQDNLEHANQHGVLMDVLIIAGRAQAWYRTPAHLGGGGGSFANLTLTAIVFDSVNVNGTYVLSDRSAGSFRVTGIGTEGTPLQVTLEVFPDSISHVQVRP